MRELNGTDLVSKCVEVSWPLWGQATCCQSFDLVHGSDFDISPFALYVYDVLLFGLWMLQCSLYITVSLLWRDGIRTRCLDHFSWLKMALCNNSNLFIRLIQARLLPINPALMITCDHSKCFSSRLKQQYKWHEIKWQTTQKTRKEWNLQIKSKNSRKFDLKKKKKFTFCDMCSKATFVAGINQLTSVSWSGF